MASRKSNDTDNALDSNVIVKAEPSTSAPVLLKDIKAEPGISTATTRLTSFRVPRDLTLGGNVKAEKPKKLYTPNLNAQRNKNNTERGNVKNESKPSRERGRGRGRGQGERGRGRGKNASTLIQSSGVFSEGIADAPRSSRWSSGPRDNHSDREPKSALEKPKLNLGHKIDKADEEEKLKLLLRDDFIENGQEPDMDNAPVMLPMTDEVAAKLYKEATKVESAVHTENEQADVKPNILENGEALPVENDKIKPPLLKKHLKEETKAITMPDIVENKNNSYILIQFPDCLPGLRTDGELNESRPKKSTESSPEDPNETKPKTEYCTMFSLKEGMLGKLQILKSGRTRLVLGENNLVVDIGSRLSFRQDLIAAKLDPEKLTGDLINLGPVSTTFICSPNWESMLASL